MKKVFRQYTGSIDYAAGMLAIARSNLQEEAKGLELRLWTEDQAGKLVESWLPQIRADLAAAQKALKDIEDTLTTVAEEQEAAA